MRQKHFKGGFTLVELSLSMLFVGVLSVVIVLIISNTVEAYRRGMTLSHVTTTGLDIVDDLRTAVQNSSSKSVTNYCTTYYKHGGADNTTDMDLCISDGAYKFIAWKKDSVVELNGESLGTVPIYGAFCTGTYSYIWNTGYYDKASGASFAEKNEDKWATLTYINANGETVTFTGDDGKPFRLLKVRDDYNGVCASVVRSGDIDNGRISYIDKGYDYSTIDGQFSMVGYGEVSEEPVDLILEDDENDLALFDLTVARPAESSTRKNTFYSVSFILGTITGGPNITAKGKSCETPESYDGYFDYCAINRFSFAVQAGASYGGLQ